MPGAKLIFLMRNPIERTWSSIRKGAKKTGNTLESLSPEAFKEMIDRRALAGRADYVKTISAWRQFYPPEQFFIGYYEEIAQTPQDFLLRLFEFLGVEASEQHITAAAGRRVNAAPPRDIPSELKVVLATQYFEQIEALSDLVGGNAATWLADIDATLMSSRQKALEPPGGRQPPGG
jgi:hypothetical protein